MNKDEYRITRKQIGSQEYVAGLLGVARETVTRRESGKMPITTEAALALKYAGRAWLK